MAWHVNHLRAALTGLWPLVVVAMVCVADEACTLAAQETAWPDALYPARVRLTVAPERAGRYELEIDPARLIELLNAVVDEPLDEDHLAFSATAIIAQGQPVGRAELAVSDENLVQHGDFTGPAEEIAKVWPGFNPSFCSVEPREGVRGRALVFRKQKIANHLLYQAVGLERNCWYLLTCKAWRDTQLGTTLATLQVPGARLFPRLDGSWTPPYYPLRPRVWQVSRQLYRSRQSGPQQWHDYVPEAHLRVSNVLVGEAAIAEIRLQRARWRFVVNLPAAGTQDLELYCVARGGHRFDDPNQATIVIDGGLPKLSPLKPPAAESNERNPQALLCDGGAIAAWTLPAAHPLIAERLPASRPRSSVPKKRLLLARGEDETLLVVLQGKSHPVTIDAVSCDLPLPTRFDTVEPVPIWEPGEWRPEMPDRVVQHRHDALVTAQFPWSPGAGCGVLAVTFRALSDTKPGAYAGQVAIRAGSVQLRLPLEIVVLPAVIEPTRHFKSLLGGGYVVAGFRGPDLEKPSLPVSAYHGIAPSDKAGYARLTEALDPNNKFHAADPMRLLMASYADRLLDFHLQLKNCAGSAPIKYKLVEQAGQARPRLTDWDFSQYNRALEYMVDKRKATAFIVAHVSNHLLCTFRTESPRRVYYCGGASVGDLLGNADKRELPEPELRELQADYYEAVATNVADHGWLGKAYILIDETRGEQWWQAMERLGMALKSRPHARFLRILHTMQGMNTYMLHVQDRDSNPLRLDGGAIDVWCPENDDNYNALDPQAWNSSSRHRPEHWAYYVRTEALNLDTAGINNYLLPLKLRQYGCQGMLDWEIFYWGGFPRGTRQIHNPWQDCRTPYGNGALSLFYPPRREGPAAAPTYDIVPSYRLVRFRDGIEDYALADVLQSGLDDAGGAVTRALTDPGADLARLWLNPVQWHQSPVLAETWSRRLRESFERDDREPR